METVQVREPAEHDEFVCDECGDTWDIEDSTRRDDGFLICPECCE